jgi:CRISPR system Cascade subunit CasC
MFIQIHMLQSMPPGNLNRDDSGQPKKCLFGGVTRGRISSQCLKRNIRLSTQFQEAFGEHLAKRTKYLPRLVAEAVAAAGKIPADEIDGIKAGIAAQFKKEARGEQEEQEGAAGAKTETTDVTPQLVFFQPAFATKIADLLASLRKDHPRAYKRLIGAKEKKGTKEEEKAADDALQAFRDGALNAKESLSVDVGLFGRMTTSDIVVDVEAACQVAHAISTHETLIESDYFTAMDDLQHRFVTSQTQGGGAAFLGSGDTETFFSSAVYYKYLNVDTDALASNVSGVEPAAVSRAAGVMIEAAALATPTGKQNSFAAHSSPDLILVEVSRRKQPISYANAFLRPVQGDDLMKASVEALAGHCGAVAAAYAPAGTKRFLLAVGAAKDVDLGLKVDRVATLTALSEAVTKCVTSGTVGAK